MINEQHAEHHHHLHDHNDPNLAESEARVPFTRFFLVTGAQFVFALLVFWLIAPHVFHNETGKPWQILCWTFALGVPLSLFEYLYHRYLLHSAVLPFMSSMQRAHGTHHGLTNVKAPVKAKEPEKLVLVDNQFPVEEKHQEESMMFPLYSVSIFIPVFLLVLALPLKLILPGSPILFSTILAVVLYYTLYEVWHAMLHLPFDKFWKPAMDSKRVGKMFRRIYGFHLMHHWRPTSNQAIAGFWGIALWDHMFRTHRRPERMPLHQAEVSYVDSRLRKPLWPISMFDSWQGGWARTSRKIESFLARVFLGRKTPTRSK